MIENITVSLVIALAVGFPLSIYAGVIVARYQAFESSVNRARNIILNLEQEWIFTCLPERISDPNSPSGKRSIYTSEALSGNGISWQLMQIGLELKEQGHWSAARIVDSISIEMDSLREEIVENAIFVANKTTFNATTHIADWHRQLSKVRPVTRLMLKPWPNKRYEHLSCISVNDQTGEWHEELPVKNEEDELS